MGEIDMSGHGFSVHEFPEFGERFAHLKIENGPEIYVIPKERSQSYALLRVPVGGLDIAYRKGGRLLRIPEGTAHFLEHKLFANEDGRDSLEILGHFGANANAYTSPTSTCYLFSCRDRFTDSLRELFRFVSEPYFTDENIAAERSVIEQEINMYEDSPSSVLYYLALRSMYRRHPLRSNIHGSALSIARLSPKKLSSVYRDFYAPCRWQLFVSGQVSLDEIAEIASAYTSAASPAVQRVLPDDDGDPHKKRAVRRMNVHLPLLAIGIKFPAPSGDAVTDARHAIARDLLHAALFGKSGGLYERLFAAGLLRAPLQISTESVPGASCLLLLGETQDPDAVCEAVREELRRMRKNGPDRADIERMRRVAYADFIASLDSVEELAEGFCSSVSEGLDLFSYGRLLLEVSYEEICDRLLGEYSENRITEVIINPLRGRRRSVR